MAGQNKTWLLFCLSALSSRLSVLSQRLFMGWKKHYSVSLLSWAHVCCLSECFCSPNISSRVIHGLFKFLWLVKIHDVLKRTVLTPVVDFVELLLLYQFDADQVRFVCQSGFDLSSGLVCHYWLLHWSSSHRGANWRGITSTSPNDMLATDTEGSLLQQ